MSRSYEMTDDARDPQAVAELQGIHKRYGKVDALQGVDLEIQPGELVALLGSSSPLPIRCPTQPGAMEGRHSNLWPRV
jgi:ABC-type ATPase with predicted acetyltransferase domain